MVSTPEIISQGLLAAMGMRMFVYYENRIPENTSLIVVSNHRSFMDAPILIKALKQPVSIVCHHYMSKTPILREFIELLGCIPLEKPTAQRSKKLLIEGTQLLNSGEWLGIFPEGTTPMVKLTKPTEVGKFHRSFAHLALQASHPNLAVLPVAIASTSESIYSGLPLKFLRLFDPTEPLFNRFDLHPVVTYHDVNVLIGRPYWINQKQREYYQGKKAKQVVKHLTEYCHQEITHLLRQG